MAFSVRATGASDGDLAGSYVMVVFSRSGSGRAEKPPAIGQKCRA